MADNSARPPNAQFCESVRQTYGLAMPVLINDRDQLRSVGLASQHTHLLLERGAKVVYRGRYGSADGAIDGEIEQLLAP